MGKRVLIAGMAAVAIAAPGAALAETSLHGFADLSLKTDYVTPRGLHVTSDGATVQGLGGLVWVFPQDPAATITNVAVTAGIWTDFNPGYEAPNTQAFNEFDWFVGIDLNLGKDWKVGAQYVEFISAPGVFETEKNIEFSASYSGKIAPIAINPYVKLFWAIDGDSTVVLGKKGGTYDVEIGAAPTIHLSPSVSLSAPTWVTVGPEEYWGGDDGNFGVFSTGLKLSYALDAPPGVGKWSIYANYQYYHLINDNLVLAQSILNPGETDEDIHTFGVGVGLGF